MRSAASMCMPAPSDSKPGHKPQRCSAACSQPSQPATVCRPLALARRASTCCTAASSAGLLRMRLLPATWRHSRTGARRSAASSASRSGSQSGAAFRLLSTSSLEAFQAQACNRAIRAAAARLVESFQPFSSRMATPASPRSARTRRVSTRSEETSATGLWPCAIWARAWAAQRCASSSPSWQACRPMRPGVGLGREKASACSGSVNRRSPQALAKPRAKGSLAMPCTSTRQSTSSACAGSNSRSLA